MCMTLTSWFSLYRQARPHNHKNPLAIGFRVLGLKVWSMHPKWLQILDEGGPAQPKTIQDFTLLSQNTTTMSDLGNLEPQFFPR